MSNRLKQTAWQQLGEIHLNQNLDIRLSALFPNEVKGKWLENKRYSLPNQDKALSEREKIVEQFAKI